MYLIELYKQGVRTPVAVSKHFKHCYSFARLIGEISEPNQTYKLALRELRSSEGQAMLWDKSRFEFKEHALHSPIGIYVLIKPVKFLKR